MKIKNSEPFRIIKKNKKIEEKKLITRRLQHPPLPSMPLSPCSTLPLPCLHTGYWNTSPATPTSPISPKYLLLSWVWWKSLQVTHIHQLSGNVVQLSLSQFGFPFFPSKLFPSWLFSHKFSHFQAFTPFFGFSKSFDVSVIFSYFSPLVIVVSMVRYFPLFFSC